MNKGFTSKKLDSFFREYLDIEGFSSSDNSLNGIQVDNDGSDISKIAFAVDASLECFKRTKQAGAGMIFVHHGIFWGKCERLDNGLRERIKYLLDHNIALYGVHLPLDQHPSLGNNAVLAELLGIESPQPFGSHGGKKVGYMGKLIKPLTIEEAKNRISFMGRPPVGVYAFGKELNQTVAIVSGGAAMDALQAIEEGVDMYVTGEGSHSVYHHAMEMGLNILAGGHYSTEVWGVRKIMELCEKELNIETEFLDLPTGL